MQNAVHHQIVIVGGGTAGISVAAQLARQLDHPDIAIIDLSDKHYYQPLWTIVGAGVFPKESSERTMASLIPKGTTWIRDAVTEFFPDKNYLTTRSGKFLSYDFLIVAPGIQIDWDKIKGLKETLGRNGVCSNYSYDHVGYTWDMIRQFQGGRAIFTHPQSPIKCGGAPQKILYLADDAFQKSSVRGKTDLVFMTANPVIFQVPKYAETLSKVVERKKIDVHYRHNLVEIRGKTKEAIFENLDTGERVTMAFDMIHVTPYMSAPDFIKMSPLADSSGWVDVDPYTLQHNRYPNVFGLGDASNLPTSKTGAAIRKQAPVVVKNLISLMEKCKMSARYDGYTSCPIVTGYGKLVLAEFGYENVIQESFPFDQSKERTSMYLLKKYGLPAMYWHGMMRGRM